MRLIAKVRHSTGMALLLAACLIGMGATVTSCATSKSKEKDDSLTKNGQANPGFFDEIPANTLYLMASVEHGSEELKSYSVGSGSTSVLTAMQSFNLDRADDELDEYPGAKALVEEFENVDDLKSYRELGLEPLAPTALYAVGGLPVARTQLADAGKFKEFVKRIEGKAKTEVDIVEHGGQKVHVYSPDALVEHTYDSEKGKIVEDYRFHFAMTVRDGEVIVTTFPTGVRGAMLDHITGKTKPENAMGDPSAVRNLNRKYGYKSFMQSGWIDIAAITRVMTGQSEPTDIGKKVMQIMGIETTELESPCSEEVNKLVQQVPRAVFGAEVFTRNKLAISGGIEIKSDISQQLGELGAPIPAYGTEMFDTSWFSMGLGINVEKYVDFGMEQASTVVNDPYQCEKLEGLNQGARRMTQMTGMVPPALRQIKSASVILRDFEMAEDEMKPETMKGVALIRARNPSSIIAQLRTVVPGLKNLKIKGDGVPVSLDQAANRTPSVDAMHLAYNDEYLGASIGVGAQDELASFLESPTLGNDSPLVSFGLDLGRVAELVSERMSEMYAPKSSGSKGSASSNKSSDAEESFAAESLGMSFMEFDANEDGVFVSYRVNMPEDSGSKVTASK